MLYLMIHDILYNIYQINIAGKLSHVTYSGLSQKITFCPHSHIRRLLITSLNLFKIQILWSCMNQIILLNVHLTTHMVHDISCACLSVKPLSQLAHDHFKTLCDPAFWHLHDGSPTLHELSLPLHAIFRSPAVASDFWAYLKFRGDRVRRFLSHWVSRSLVRASYNVVCTCKSGARTFEVVRWFAYSDASVVQPWDCCSTCGMWSCNVVLPLHDY